MSLLAEKNAHLRDSSIQFFEDGHKYIILSDQSNKYVSVTTWVHSHFQKFDLKQNIFVKFAFEECWT